MERRIRVLVGVALMALTVGVPGESRAQPADPVEATYLEARALRQAGDLPQAVALLEGLVTDHLDHATAPHSVDLLLDSLNRLQRFDRFTEWLERLAGEEAFLARHPAVAERLARLRRQAARRLAETRATAGDYAGCAVAYVDLLRADPNGPDGDEVAYNAGICYREAGAVGAALKMFRIVVDRFPKSAIAMRALSREASGLDSIAYHREAAERYELYAKRYAGEKDAPAALERAIELRAGLGQGREALALVQRYRALYRRQLAANVARVWLAATDLHPPTDTRARIAHLRAYLRDFGGAASHADRVVVHAELGRLLWHQSCARPDATGLCITRRRAGKAKLCKPTISFQPVRRDSALVKEARAALSQAVKLFEHASASDPRARTAHAMARFYLAEPDAEALITARAPPMGDYDPNDRSKLRQFADWLRMTQQSVARFVPGNGGAYGDAMLDASAGEWPAAAMLRTAQVLGGLADAVAAMEIPSKLASGPYGAEVVTAYCDDLARNVEPVDDQRISVLERCTALPTHNQWSHACARQLEALDPERFPPLRERVGKLAQGLPFDRPPFALTAQSTASGD